MKRSYYLNELCSELESVARKLETINALLSDIDEPSNAMLFDITDEIMNAQGALNNALFLIRNKNFYYGK